MNKEQFLKGATKWQEDSYTDFWFFKISRPRVEDKETIETFLIGDVTHIEMHEQTDEKGFRYQPTWRNVLCEDGQRRDLYRAMSVTIRSKFEVFYGGYDYSFPHFHDPQWFGTTAKKMIEQGKIYSNRVGENEDQTDIRDIFETRKMAESAMLEAFWNLHEKELLELNIEG